MSNLGTAIICLLAACGVTQITGGYDLNSAAAPPVFHGTTGNCADTVTPPSTAVSAGFTNLAFCDDFDSLSTIDVNSTGAPGYNWYTRLPFDRGRTPQSFYSVSDSFLAVTAPNSINFALTTMDPHTGNGNAWIFGYFEARLSFDPNAVPTAGGWPAWWANSARHLHNDTRYTSNPYVELDFFECPPKRTEFAGTIHQWEDSGKTHHQNANAIAPVSVNWAKWHTVGVLWVPGKVVWYLDGRELIEQRYSTNGLPRPSARAIDKGPQLPGLFSSLDTDKPGEQMILGSAQGWPLNVDWIRVWH
jgi:hypothetical protein